MEQGQSVLIVGATGMVGGHALQLSLEHPDVSAVTVIGRRSVGVEHPKLREVVHADFTDCNPIADALAGHEVALYCRRFVEASALESPVALSTLVRQMADSLGLTSSFTSSR